MTMVEDKETNDRSICPTSSDYATIVPIKKRRFPFIEPPSSPPEDPRPVQEQDKKLQESTSISQVSAILNVTTEECKPEDKSISEGSGASSASQQSEDGYANQDKLEHIPVKTKLTYRESSFDESIGGVMKSECDVNDLCKNRSNWDLNTTMDAWEGPAGDAMLINKDNVHEITADGSGNQVHIKSLDGSIEMAELNVAGEQSGAEHQSAEADATSSIPSTNSQTHEDPLKLGLQVALLTNARSKPPYLSPRVDPQTNFCRVSPTGSASIVSHVAVKLEPCEEFKKQASSSFASGDLRPSMEIAMKHETVDRSGPEIYCISSKFLNPRSLNVKAEPAFEAATITLKTLEETSNRLEQVSEDMLMESCSKVAELLAVNSPMVNESQTISNTDGYLGKEDNEYEDGEVQDQTVADLPAEPMEATEGIPKCEGESDNMEFAGDISKKGADSSSPQHKEDTEMQLCGDDEENLDEKSQMSADFDAHLQDLSDVELESDTNESATFSQGTTSMPDDENLMIHPENVGISFEATPSDHEVDEVLSQDGNEEKTENVVSQDEKNDLILHNADSCVNSDAIGRDSNMESNRSRIINLSATFNMSSSHNTNSASQSRSMPLHDGRKRLPNVALEGDRLHPRGRNEVGSDFHRFSRERNRDMFSRNYRSDFARDRGRVPSNMFSDWESEQDFGSEMRSGPLEFRTTRYRYNLDYRNYNVSHEDGFVGHGRGGHKLLTDNSRFFHGQHSLRRAHGGRDGHATRGPPMVDRLAQNMSPSRCIGMDDSELVGVRAGFVRRERNIGSFSGKGINRIHSKSPVRLRSRSPVQWSSPRRRSPEGFARHQDMPPRRSPPMYRRERIGSPDRACFHSDAMMRQPNSPPYISRELDDLREMNSRDRGFSRPMIHNGSSSTRGSLRTRRYDSVNSRERTHREYFRVPMRDMRFHELSVDVTTDERTGLNEKRGPFRHFRPCGSENKDFSYSGDDGSRSYRLCSEDNSLYPEGGNSREKRLDRHSRIEPGDTHKTRKIEDQDGSFREGESGELDDLPRHKRERF
ncbi:hypothetical protein SAY86_031467 [Trapa natans]|uniref:Uncharacterized protein n=1 Tax=Trapa natans TaxID=22666 RepID=A0AAN7LUA3_TRANT|nr:hypothetical protein SAY86_031467 [Trapa natans]